MYQNRGLKCVAKYCNSQFLVRHEKYVISYRGIDVFFGFVVIIRQYRFTILVCFSEIYLIRILECTYDSIVIGDEIQFY